MAEKRTDTRGIVLQNGEFQLKTGKYRFRYYDDAGKQHEVTSWRLRKNDPMPEGRKPELSLREMEKEIQDALEKGLRVWDAGMTVSELVKKYMERQWKSWAANTRQNHEATYKNRIEPSKFGKKKIGKVSADDIEQFYQEMIDNGYAASSLSVVDKLINPAFRMAVKQKTIASNPASGAYGVVKRASGQKPTQKHALEQADLNSLLDYTKENYQQYFPLLYFLAWTGTRIGEACGLTWGCVDFDAELIHITHTLEHVKIDGKYTFERKRPKTDAGIREIPMLKDVKKILLKLKQDRKVTRIGGGWRDNLVFTKDGEPYTQYRGIICQIVRNYNQSTGGTLTDVSPHTFRHTFTCWLIECFSLGADASMLDNLKYIQRILGHSDATTTLNVYAEIRPDKLKEKHDILRKAAEA